MISPFFIFSQTDIATARSQGVGATVTVTGIVTNGDELGAIRYIEDGTAGLGLYDPSVLGSVQRGDELTVSGVLVDYNGLLEMTPVNSNATISTGNSVTPQVVTPIQIGEATEGELVQINNVVFNNGGSSFTSGTHDFTANGESGKIYIRSGHPLENTLIPMGSITLIGVSSQYTFTGVGGYQILPRDSLDIIQSGPIVFTSGVTQSNITTNSFDLSWTVSVNSSTNCDYGTTIALGTSINNTTNTQTHTITLTSLQPATFYHVKCYSISGSDTAFSSTGIYSTASNSSGIIRPYFNHTVDNSFSSGVDADDIGSAFRDTIKAYMDLAQNTLDICVYNANSVFLANAINDAKNRGVQVRYIADDDGANTMLSNLDPTIPVVYRDPSLAGIMHNKFIIVDVNSPNNSWVMGGSTNWTDPQNLMNDYNNIIFIQDQAIAKAYTLEFEEMWGGVFGGNKQDNTPHKFNVNGINMEVYFSPSDQTTSQIINLIENVDKTLEFGLLSFTRDDISDAVINKDIEFGVTVRGIIETEGGTGAEYPNLLAANVNVLSHQGVTHQFHHKYAIVDANHVNDNPAVLTGSHNWSTNAEDNSDENTMIIYDQTIANIYLQEFEKRWNELGGTTTEIDDLIKIETNIFPNPSSGIIDVESDLDIEQIKIYDLTGRYLFSTGKLNIKISQKGTYFLKIITDKGNIIRKVLVQ